MKRVFLVAVLALTGCGGESPEVEVSPSSDVRADCAERGGRYLPASDSCIGGEDDPDATATPRPSNRATARPTPEPPAREELALVEQGFTYFPGDTEYLHFAVIFENPNPDTWVAERTNVNLTWYDAAGGVAGSQSEYLNLGLPGQRVAAAGIVFDVSDPVEMEVQYRVGSWTEIDFTPGEFTFRDVTTEPQQFGGPITRGLVVSSFEEEQELVRIAAVYKDANGAVLGGDTGFAEFVPAMGQIGFEVNPLGAFQGIATTEVYASP